MIIFYNPKALIIRASTTDSLSQITHSNLFLTFFQRIKMEGDFQSNSFLMDLHHMSP